MTEQLRLAGPERVLEVGTGSGYQTALLALLADEVFSIEVVPELAERARALLVGTLGHLNVRLRTGDGSLGWPEEAPFDRIIVTAAAPEVPAALLAQLAPGGRMILPVGPVLDAQVLRLVVRGRDGVLDRAGPPRRPVRAADASPERRPVVGAAAGVRGRGDALRPGALQSRR